LSLGLLFYFVAQLLLINCVKITYFYLCACVAIRVKERGRVENRQSEIVVNRKRTKSWRNCLHQQSLNNSQKFARHWISKSREKEKLRKRLARIF